MRAIGWAAIPLLACAIARGAMAQCPSCSNPNLTAAAPSPLAGGPVVGRWMISADATYLRATDVVQGTGASDLTRSLEETTDTAYQHRVLRLGARARIAPGWAVEGALPLEEREMLNRNFPAEGAFGIRRHLLLRGVGDAELLVRREWSEVPPYRGRLALYFGSSLPTGPTLPATTQGPYETVMQIGAGTFRPQAGFDGSWRAGMWVGAARAEVRLGLYENGDGFRRGSSWAMRLLGGALVGGDRVALAAGLDYGSSGPDARRGATVRNTGGESLGAMAVAQIGVSRGIGFTTWTRIPIARRVEGFQLAESVAAGVGATFAR